MTPKTGIGKLVLLAYALLILFITETYTANLATMLVVESIAHTGCRSLRECLDENQAHRACVRTGTAVAEYISSDYAQYISSDLSKSQIVCARARSHRVRCIAVASLPLREGRCG